MGADGRIANRVLSAWKAAADWCYDNEPFLLAYEVSLSDQRPLTYFVTERYRSKDDYLARHKKSVAYDKFRPLLQRAIDGGDVVVTGESGDETGLGFT